MKNDVTYINLSEDMWIEVQYTHEPESPSNDYDVPPDSAITEINKVLLCGWIPLANDTKYHVHLDITHYADYLSHLLSWDKIQEAVQTEIEK